MTELATTKMSSKGQVVIPETIRRRLGLKAGTQFVVVAGKDAVILKAISPPSLDEFLDLHVTRLVAELAGMLRKYKGRFILSRNCRALLAKDGLAGVYPRLFRTYVEQFNWDYWDRYPAIRFLQQAFLFTLYLLTRYGNVMRPHEFYEDSFLRAFPSVLNEVPPEPYSEPEKTLRNCYTWRTLVHFAGFLGLAEVEPVTEEFLCRRYQVRALPLLRETVQFQLSE